MNASKEAGASSSHTDTETWNNKAATAIALT